jgi:hypothetical protein
MLHSRDVTIIETKEMKYSFVWIRKLPYSYQFLAISTSELDTVNGRAERHTLMDYTYFPNTFFAILHSSQALMFIYYR